MMQFEKSVSEPEMALANRISARLKHRFKGSPISGGIFWKLYLTYSWLFNLTLLCVVALLYISIKSALWDSTARHLREKISLIRPFAMQLLKNPAADAFKDEIVILGRTSQTRITIIDSRGSVLADSGIDHRSSTNNHLSRPEIQSALNDGNGQVIRFSESLDMDMLYIARTIHSGQTWGILRVAIPVLHITRQSQNLLILMVVAAILGIVLILIASYFFARKFTDPVTELIKTCEYMIEGFYHKKIKKISRDEMGILAYTLNKLGDEVNSRVSTISLERAQLQSMLSAMVEGIISVDHENRILFHNRAACRLFSPDQKDLTGTCLPDRDEFSKLMNFTQDARLGECLVESELILQSGTRRSTLEVHASPFQARHGLGVIIVLHDITRIRELEQVRQDFVANISHEIKTPLTSIKGYVETLLGGAIFDSSNNVRFLQKVLSNTDRLTFLVQDILSLAKIESDNANLQIEPQDWLPLIRAISRQYEETLLTKSLTLEIHHQPFKVSGDRESMTQVIDNLVSNAIRYTQSGGSIKVRTYPEGNWGILEIQDTGIGIPARDLDRIFERFYRVDKDRSRSLGGTGLGLSIVKHLCSGMSGSVTVASIQGDGSTFRVRLPLTPNI